MPFTGVNQQQIIRDLTNIRRVKISHRAVEEVDTVCQEVAYRVVVAVVDNIRLR